MEHIKLNLIPTGPMPVCHASQYDTGRKIGLDIYNGLQPYILTDEQIELDVRKSDGRIVTLDVPITAKSNTVVFSTTEQMCAVAGSNLCELKITKNEEVIHSLNFAMEIERSPMENGLQSESEINNLNRQIDDHLDEVLPDMVDEIAEPIIDEKVPEKVTELVPSAVEEAAPAVIEDVAPPILERLAPSVVREVAPPIVEELVPIAVGDNYYNKTQTNGLINPINNTLALTVESKTSINQLDINTIVRGTLDWAGKLVESSSADYYVTPFIEIKENDYIHYITSGNETTIQRISLYNANKSFLENVNSQVNYKVVNANAKFVRLQIYKTVINPIRAMVCITDSSTTPAFEWCYKPYTKTIGTRPRVDIYSEDGIDNFWLNMQEAFYKGNCDVYIHKGEYVYSNDLIDKIRSLNRRGIPIGNGCRYYFETGANLTCEYTGDNATDVKGYFSPLDSWNIASDYEIYNLNLSSKNTIYALHDEANGEETPIKHIYKDCHISLDNTSLGAGSSALSKCIGGGLGLHSVIDIENCVFSTINPNSENDEDVTYHKANNQSYTDCNMTVMGCYFGGKFRCDFDYSPVPSIVSKIVACGNSAKAISAYQWNYKIWNNEIRQ